MANEFITILDKAAAETKKIAIYAVSKVLPVIDKAAVAAEPVVDLALTAAGLGSVAAEYNIVANAVLATQQAAAILPAGLTGEQKAAFVLQAVEAKLLPGLVASGLTTAAAEAKLVSYIQAVYTTLTTFFAPALSDAAASKAS